VKGKVYKKNNYVN